MGGKWDNLLSAFILLLSQLVNIFMLLQNEIETLKNKLRNLATSSPQRGFVRTEDKYVMTIGAG